MKLLIPCFLSLLGFSGNTQINDIGIHYSAIRLSKSYYLKNANIISVQVGFISKHRFSTGIAAFYGGNHVPAKSYDIPEKFNVQTLNVLEGKNVVSSFSGRQAGIGLGIYYQITNKKRYVFSPGVKSSVSFFTRADAEYGTIYLTSDSLNNYISLRRGLATTNCDNLLDARPDIFLINLEARNQFILSTHLNVLLEPFVSMIGILKTRSYFLPSAGANAGLIWKL
jgi:hypothetical protein